MTPDELLDLSIKSAEKQIELTHQSMERHLDESERIHARNASEKLVNVARDILADPTSAAQ